MSWYRNPEPYQHSRKRPLLLVLALVFLAAGGLAYALVNDHPAIAAVKRAVDGHTITTTTAVSSPTPLATTLTHTLAADMATNDADADVAVYDSKTGQTIHYSNTTGTYNTASIVKLSILEELLLQDQAVGTGITNNQLSYATPMIENSDNDAATELWDEVGQGPKMQSFFDQVGTDSTTVNPAGHWGLTQTTALDQLKIVNQFAYPDHSSLNSASIGTITNLLSNVEEDQTWGVSGGVPASATVLLKNGWLDDTDGWDVNSIGHVTDDNVDYTIAILSDKNDTEQTGIDTVQALSTDVYSALAGANSTNS